MTIIGIDPSINSTGVCVNEDGKYTYYIICSKMTKKMEQFSNPYIRLISYDKTNYQDLEYSEKEFAKTRNACSICYHLSQIVDKHKPDKVYMEGVSYGSVGSAALVDLAGLNFMIRHMLFVKCVEFQIVSPTSNKKSFTGNGQADKDVMVDSWKRMDKNIYNIKEIKLDDLADAFALSCYREDDD